MANDKKATSCHVHKATSYSINSVEQVSIHYDETYDDYIVVVNSVEPELRFTLAQLELLITAAGDVVEMDR
jgi:hypothetical protein